MDNVLSQDEVNALLQGVSDGEIETQVQPMADETGVIPYDLTSRDRIIRDRMPSLEMTHVRFARFLRTSLSALMRRVVEVNLLSTEMVKFGDFLNSIALPTTLNLFRLKPLPGLAMLVLDGNLVYALVDGYFGGIGRGAYKVEGRDFTPVEHSVIRKIVSIALTDLEAAWRPVNAIETEFTQSEVNPQFVSLVPPTELTIVVSFEIAVDQVVGEMTVCIPYSTIEPIRHRLSSAFQSELVNIDPEWLKALRDSLLQAQVHLRVILGTAEINVGDVLHLQVGDVIPLRKNVTDPLDVYVEGVAKFKGVPGVFKGNQALQVTNLVFHQVDKKRGRGDAQEGVSRLSEGRARGISSEVPLPRQDRRD